MEWARRLTKQQLIKSAIWLLVAFSIMAALAYWLNNVAAANALEYEIKNPMRIKNEWHPSPSVLSIGLLLCGIFVSGAAVGAGIGQLTRHHQFAWSVMALVLAIVPAVWALKFLF